MAEILGFVRGGLALDHLVVVTMVTMSMTAMMTLMLLLSIIVIVSLPLPLFSNLAYVYSNFACFIFTVVMIISTAEFVFPLSLLMQLLALLLHHDHCICYRCCSSHSRCDS